MTSIAVFPGQGAQAVGMGRALYDWSPAARAVFDEVDEALGEPLSTLIFEGSAERLTLTANAQPALMATSLAAVRALEERAGAKLATLVGYVAGHSLGEHSALAATGAIRVGDAARLLRLRGQAMQDAVPAGEGAMAAILGADVPTVEAVVAEAAAAGGVCALANDNGEGQQVISGSAAAVERAVVLAKERGARRSIMLQVSAPFHCALMSRRPTAWPRRWPTVPLVAPAVPVIANVTAEPVQDIRRHPRSPGPAGDRPGALAREHGHHGPAGRGRGDRVRCRQGADRLGQTRRTRCGAAQSAGARPRSRLSAAQLAGSAA